MVGWLGREEDPAGGGETRLRKWQRRCWCWWCSSGEAGAARDSESRTGTRTGSEATQGGSCCLNNKTCMTWSGIVDWDQTLCFQWLPVYDTLSVNDWRRCRYDQAQSISTALRPPARLTQALNESHNNGTHSVTYTSQLQRPPRVAARLALVLFLLYGRISLSKFRTSSHSVSGTDWLTADWLTIFAV